MLRKLAISVVAIATLVACGPTHHNSAVVAHNSSISTAVTATNPAITTLTPANAPGVANPFDQPGYECYAQGDQVLCNAPGKPTIVKVDVFSPEQCAYYTGLVWMGKLAPEVVYDPASPCRKFPLPTMPTCANQPDTACVEADGTIR